MRQRATLHMYWLGLRAVYGKSSAESLSLPALRGLLHLMRLVDRLAPDENSEFVPFFEEILLKRIAEKEGAPLSHRFPEKPPPGSTLARLCLHFFSPQTCSFVLQPTLSDLAEEHALALAEGRPWKARLVRLRGYWSFWMAVAAHLVAVLGRRVARFWARS